jgi:hypothetical protein
MRFLCLLIVVLTVATTASAQFSDEPSERNNLPRNPKVQVAVGFGWRFDHVESARTGLAELGMYFRSAPFSAVQARITYQPQQSVYYTSRLTILSFAVGLRLQAPHSRICGFGSLELDESWYHGQTAVYSADQGKSIGRVSLTDFKPGVAFSGGVAIRLSRNLSIDVGLRKVLNKMFNTVHEMTIPPLSGEYYLKFPSELYNQATLFLQTRIGL